MTVIDELRAAHRKYKLKADSAQALLVDGVSGQELINTAIDAAGHRGFQRGVELALEILGVPIYE